MSAEAAEALAIQALTFLAGEPERIGRFFALTGIEPEEIRSLARQPAFLVAVLDHLCSDEPLLLAFAEQIDIEPAAVAQAGAILGGKRWERETA